ncbi:MAG: hypothetical protein JWM81_1183 [Candidatus Saccharibacteria bacterium]|nr:hypothetical protein [Candidatus Saccharibacteria bacterium]
MIEETRVRGRLQLIAESKNGVKVYFDTVSSHAATHLQDAPELERLVAEVVSKLELKGQEVAAHFDMGRIVGTCDVVAVSEKDEIVYGMRKNRDDDGLVPFVKNRDGEPCPFVAVHLLPQPDTSYLLSSAWIGTFGEDDEPFPKSHDANERSVDFWSSHAFVYGSQEIIKGTETTVRPW